MNLITSTSAMVCRIFRADGDEAQGALRNRIRLPALCAAGSVVVDVGANLGDFGIKTALMGCTSYVFEVQAMYLPLLSRSAALNSIGHKYHLCQGVVLT